MVKCPKCPSNFGTRSEMISHYMKIHHVVKEEPAEKNMKDLGIRGETW